MGPSGYFACANCGERIISVNYALGPEWMHTGSVHHFGEEYRHCRGAVATPGKEWRS